MEKILKEGNEKALAALNLEQQKKIKSYRCAASEGINMEASKEIKDRIKRLNEHSGRYIPHRKTWTHADEALYTTDLYRVPAGEARAMQLRSYEKS